MSSFSHAHNFLHLNSSIDYARSKSYSTQDFYALLVRLVMARTLEPITRSLPSAYLMDHNMKWTCSMHKLGTFYIHISWEVGKSALGEEKISYVWLETQCTIFFWSVFKVSCLVIHDWGNCFILSDYDSLVFVYDCTYSCHVCCFGFCWNWHEKHGYLKSVIVKFSLCNLTCLVRFQNYK